MTDSQRPAVVVLDGRHEISGEPDRVVLLVTYADKEARIELPEASPSFDREPGEEIYRREVRELARALLEAADAPQGIRWPYHPRTSRS